MANSAPVPLTLLAAPGDEKSGLRKIIFGGDFAQSLVI